METIDRSDQDGPRPAPKRRLPTGVTLLLGVVLGALVAAPVGVYAASERVSVAGPDGTTAQVTPARQVKAAEASTSQFVRGVGFANTPNVCTKVLDAPAANGVVVKTVFIDVYAAPAVGSGQHVALYSGSTCDDGTTLVARHNPGGVGSEQFQFEPGLIVAPGHSLWAKVQNNVRAEVYAFGYRAPGIPAPPASPPAGGGAEIPQG